MVALCAEYMLRSEKELLYRIGTARELDSQECEFPEFVAEKVLYYVTVLDGAYGMDRDYLKSGGYVLVAQNCKDIADVKVIVDYDVLLSEWVEVIGDNYLAVLYLLGDDYSIVVIMPKDIAPSKVLEGLKEEC